jgi:quercetin dioxygenase-like cupin family protein
MENQPAPMITKIDVLDKAQAQRLFVLGRLGDVVLAIDAVFTPEDIEVGWGSDDEVEYHYCLRGSAQVQFKDGDQELPPFTVNAGEILTIPAGVATRGTRSDDNVMLIMERSKPWHT